MQLKPGSEAPIKVGLRGISVIGWLCVVLFSAGTLGAFFAHQFMPAALFFFFLLIGVLLIVSAGELSFDSESVTHTAPLGTFRMNWREIKSAGYSLNATFVLYGEGKHFVLPSSAYWSGPERLTAHQFFVDKINELGIVPALDRSADFRLNKNVRAPKM